jgi:hypothetical protein
MMRPPLTPREVDRFHVCRCDRRHTENLASTGQAEEDNRAQSGTARIALQHLEEMAAELKQKWHEDYASLKKMS